VPGAVFFRCALTSQPLAHGQTHQGRHQVPGPPDQPGGALGGHPGGFGQPSRRRARRLRVGAGADRVAGRGQLGVEAAGDVAVAALVRVQPVHAPVPALVGGGVAGRVQVHGPVLPGHLVHGRVHRAHPAGQRPGQRSRQPEHLSRVGQSHGEHLRARRLQRGHRPGD